MLLTAARQPWADSEWISEPKLDGYRLRAQVVGKEVELRTRGGALASRWYPEVVAGLAGLTKTRTVLDGEVVVLDDKGRSDFERVHARSRRRRWYAGADPVVFVVFDILVHRGRDVRGLSLLERKKILGRLLAQRRPNMLLCQHFSGEDGPQLYRIACDLKLEGIVMKRLASPYVGGEPRTGDWVKVKRPGATPPQRFERGDLSL